MKKPLLPALGVLILLIGVFLSGSRSTAAPGSGGNKKASAVKKGKSSSKALEKAPTAQEIKEGLALYKAQDCGACHSIAGQGCKDGVPLDGIGKRRSQAFLLEQLKDPEGHVSKNKQAFGGDPVNLMPTPDLEPAQSKLIVKYLQSLN